MNKLKYILIFSLFISAFNMQYTFAQKSIGFIVKKGILDLRAMNFSSGNAVFEGEMNFYKSQFISYDKLSGKNDYSLINTKTSWNNQADGYINFSAKGYGTYHFKILLNQKDIGKQFMIRPNHFIAYASEFFINNKLVSVNGNIGISGKDINYKPYRNTECIPFLADSTTLDVIIHVANFSHFRGGIFSTINFGLAQNIIKQREKSITIDLVVIISLLLMFVYQMILYFVNKKDNVALFFSLTSLIFALDFSLQDTMVFFIFFPNSSFAISSFIHAATPYLLPSSFIFFLYALFPNEVSKKIRNLTGIISIVLLITIPLASGSLGYYISKPHYVYMLMVIFYIYFVSIKAVINKRPGAIQFLVAYLFFSACALNDLLLMFEVISSRNLVAAGLLVFVFLLSIFQGKHSSKMNKNNYRLSKELKELNIGLEDQVKSRTVELNSSLEKLKKYSLFKEDMTQMLVHDLKNPLNTLINLPDSLSQEKKGEIRKYSAQKMHSLIMNILDVKKYEDTELKIFPTTVSISKLWKKIVRQQQYLIKQKNIEVINAGSNETFVNADKELTERVLSNLLSNALKYIPNNGKINLNCEKENDSFCKISITDNGFGIPKNKLSVIFEKYKQSGERIKYSTGLGLTFCKMAVEKHGGTISIESEEDKGTSVSFTLPASGSKQSVKKQTGKVKKIVLSAKEKLKLSEFLPKFNKLDLSEITAYRKVFKDIENENIENSEWFEAFKNSVYHCNETEYNKLKAMI